ncbi:MAG: hypothetical protein LBU25_05170 [Treponema sp.]|jgi:hypothetical protein|nr:hypothetical protein [Treponema sp.]
MGLDLKDKKKFCGEIARLYQDANKKERGKLLDEHTITLRFNRDYLAHIRSNGGKTRYVGPGDFLGCPFIGTYGLPMAASPPSLKQQGLHWFLFGAAPRCEDLTLFRHPFRLSSMNQILALHLHPTSALPESGVLRGLKAPTPWTSPRLFLGMGSFYDG